MTDVPDSVSETVEQTEAWRELRIAPVLTGGTSLAVWIGGVTAELYRVVNCIDDVRSADRVYRRLLDLTRTRALVDVVTGTSAGGLNGVLLSTAWSMRVPTDHVVGLRDLWMDLGAITSLLRSPNERHPPSLLRGDEYFWPQLTRVVGQLAAAGAVTRSSGTGPVARRPVDLALTVTTLSGDLTRRTDDLGQELQETRQDHTIRFRTDDFGSDDPDWARRLGLASRTSASIPGVFEASYLPVDEPALDRPAFGDRASFSVGRWAVDGGVLANQPLGAALPRIIEQSAERELRRVALFVNPTPGEGPPDLADDPRADPPLAKVAASAFTAPRHIGIRHEIDDLRDYNERIRRSVDVGRGVARVVATASRGSRADSVETMARSLYPKFRHDRAVLSVTSMLDRVGPGIVERGFPRKQVEEALIDAVRSTDHWLPHELDRIEVGRDWQWGLAPVDHHAGLLLELVRRAFRLPVWIVDDERRAALGGVRKAIHAALATSAEARRLDSAFWRQVIAERPGELFAWARQCYRAWPDASAMDDGGRGGDLAAEVKARSWEAALALAGCTRTLLDALTDLAPGAMADGEPVEVREDLATIADLRSLLDVGDLEAVESVRRMVALHIVAVSLGDTSRRPAEIELVEVSWRAANALDPQRPLTDKLAGTEFSRLGAFVKRAWRANDWMWGRMDGAAQMVRLLLDPRRLRQLGLVPDDVVATLSEVSREPVTDAERRELESELGYLYPQAHQVVPVPASLPCTTEAFLRRVQIDIAREELPEVHFAVLRSVAEGAGEGDGGDFCRAFAAATSITPASQLADDEVVRLFRRCRVGAETASTEVGQDALTRTAGATALVAANAVTGERSGLRWPSRVSRPFRQVALLGYVLTRSATATSKAGLAITAVLSALAGAIVAMFLLSGRTSVAVNSGLVLLALGILAGGLFLAILRSGVVAALPGFLALLVVALALLGSGISQVVTGTAERDPDLSWRHVVFLGPWSLATIVLVVASIGWVLSAIARVRSADRLHLIAVAQADHRGAPPPPRPRGPFVELVIAAVVIPLVLFLHRPFFRWLLVGDDEGWRAWVIDAGTWLGDRAIVMVLAGVLVFGLFFGLAWDRSVGALLAASKAWLRPRNRRPG